MGAWNKTGSHSGLAHHHHHLQLRFFVGSGRDHRLRIRILWILKVPEIREFLRILKLSILKFIKFKLSHSSPPSSNKFFIANIALNFWIKKFCDVNSARFVSSSTVQRDHEQLITKSTNRLQFHCLPLCQNRSPRSSLPTVRIQRLPQCNRLLVCCSNSKTLQLLVIR